MRNFGFREDSRLSGQLCLGLKTCGRLLHVPRTFNCLSVCLSWLLGDWFSDPSWFICVERLRFSDLEEGKKYMFKKKNWKLLRYRTQAEGQRVFFSIFWCSCARYDPCNTIFHRWWRIYTKHITAMRGETTNHAPLFCLPFFSHSQPSLPVVVQQ